MPLIRKSQLLNEGVVFVYANYMKIPVIERRGCFYMPVFGQIINAIHYSRFNNPGRQQHIALLLLSTQKDRLKTFFLALTLKQALKQRMVLAFGTDIQ